MPKKMTYEHEQKCLSALKAAEEFISGFEDDETQEGIAELLHEVRTALGMFVEQAKREPRRREEYPKQDPHRYEGDGRGYCKHCGTPFGNSIHMLEVK